MKCPFRVDISWQYKQIGEGTYVQTRQKEDYPECIEAECPFYDVFGCFCKRAEYEVS